MTDPHQQDQQTASGQDPHPALSQGPTRRAALFGGGALAGGTALGVATLGGGAIGAGAMGLADRYAAPERNAGDNQGVAPWAEATEGFYGLRQAGVATSPQAHASFIAADLNPGAQASDVRRLLRVLTEDAAALTRGEAPLADQEPELAQTPARLTATVGFGPRIFEVVAPRRRPEWLKPLPAFEQIDQLQERYSDGDLLLQLCCEDRLVLAHAQRVLLKDLRSFGSIRWIQSGFRNTPGTKPRGTTMRNLFGQVDGTVNPSVEDGSMDRFVYGQADMLEPWAPGGTSVVIRRIHMNLDTWDELDRAGREEAIGRKLSNGAPLTGQQESDPTDLSAKGPLGFPVIPQTAHIRRAAATAPEEQILRRPYNYDLPVTDASGFQQAGEAEGGVSRTGLIFASYQADPVRQFLPIQQRLAELDMLNVWTVPIGSAVFAIPPGCQRGGFIGDFLFAGE